jgi:osmotically-inducible protein OsmY
MISFVPIPAGRFNVRKDDRRLARRIAEVFERELSKTELQGIRFFVRSGVVEIRGLVGSEADRKLLESIVSEIHGVDEVRNRTCPARARIYYLSGRKAS